MYSIDRHVSIEKYNILWFKGIAALRLCPKSRGKVSFGNGPSQLIGQTAFLPKKSLSISMGLSLGIKMAVRADGHKPKSKAYSGPMLSTFDSPVNAGEEALSVFIGRDAKVPFEVAQKVAPSAVAYGHHDLFDAQEASC